jgi:hypothetical protein
MHLRCVCGMVVHVSEQVRPGRQVAQPQAQLKSECPTHIKCVYIVTCPPMHVQIAEQMAAIAALEAEVKELRRLRLPCEAAT